MGNAFVQEPIELDFLILLYVPPRRKFLHFVYITSGISLINYQVMAFCSKNSRLQLRTKISLRGNRVLEKNGSNERSS